MKTAKYLDWTSWKLKKLVLILDALQPHSTNIKVSRLSCVNWMVCLGNLFGGKLRLFAMVIVKAFDQAIWYLKMILPEDTLYAEFTCTTATLLQPLSFLRGSKCRTNTKNPYIYSADGQIVIPLVSLAISQASSQSGDEHTKIREHYILSHSDAEAKFHGCELPRLKCTGGHWQKICTRQPWTPPPSYVWPPSLHFLPPLSEKKIIYINIWKAADYMKYISDFHI